MNYADPVPDAKADDPSLPPSESDQVRRAATGDAPAFEALVRRYYGPVLTYVYRMIGDRHRAEDLTQETFMRCHGARTRLNPSLPFSSFLFTIASNLCRNKMRDRNLARERLSAPRVTRHGFQQTAPDSKAAVDETMERLRRSLLELPFEQRAAVLLREYEGMSHGAIAQIFEANENTVRSWILRAKRSLVLGLEKEMGR